MSPRLAGALLSAAIVAAAAAWLFASRSSEPIPVEPPVEAAPAPAPVAPAPAPIRVREDPGSRVEPPPAPPGSSASAPPVGTDGLPPPPPVQLPGDPKLRQLPAELRPPAAPPAAPRFPLTKEGIRSAVQDAKPELRECYDAWLKSNPALGGTLKAAFRIVADGGTEAAIDRVRLADDAGMGNIAFEGCVLSVMSSLRFDPPQDGVLDVTYPLTFSSDGGQ